MEKKMDLISIEVRIALLKNLLDDPYDEISREILRLSYAYDESKYGNIRE
jgi:hypothetical protein